MDKAGGRIARYRADEVDGQGHVASTVPVLGHPVDGMQSGTLNTVLFLAKGSLFMEQTDAGYRPRRP
jgi:hypothetical protein